VEAQLKNAMKGLTVEKLLSSRGKYGMSAEVKMEFAQKIKAMAEGTNSAGGYLVPQEIVAGIARIVEDFGLVRKFATKFPMNENTLNVPRLSSSVTVSWPGENTAGTASDAALGNVALVAKTAVGLTVVSNEFLADANIDVVDYLLTLFAEALAGEEDNQGLAGAGSPFTGILTDAGVNVVTMATTNTTFNKVTADYLRDLVSQIKPLALQGSCFIMHRTVFGYVQKLKDGANQYLVTNPTPSISSVGEMGGPAGTPAGYVWGYPVYLSEKMPYSDAVSTKYIIFGNLKYVFFGDRAVVEVGMSESATIGATNAFAANQKVVRVTERVAIAVGIPTAFACLKTSAT
jgi:HK97 family phage major capsid protein